MSNYMKGVAKLLGLELREEFRIEKCQGLFRFTEDGLQRVLDSSATWTFAEHSILRELLNGKLTFVKFPRKPEYNEKYYIPSINNADGYNDFYWEGDDSDNKYYNLGLVFKSKEEAIALGQKMLAVAKENNEQ